MQALLCPRPVPWGSSTGVSACPASECMLKDGHTCACQSVCGGRVLSSPLLCFCPVQMAHGLCSHSSPPPHPCSAVLEGHPSSAAACPGTASGGGATALPSPRRDPFRAGGWRSRQAPAAPSPRGSQGLGSLLSSQVLGWGNAQTFKAQSSRTSEGRRVGGSFARTHAHTRAHPPVNKPYPLTSSALGQGPARQRFRWCGTELRLYAINWQGREGWPQEALA